MRQHFNGPQPVDQRPDGRCCHEDIMNRSTISRLS
jgi:hypothetical protein